MLAVSAEDVDLQHEHGTPKHAQEAQTLYHDHLVLHPYY